MKRPDRMLGLFSSVHKCLYSVAMTIIQAASAVIRDQQGRFLFVLRGRAPRAGLWSLPGGKATTGETIEETVQREVAEETGLIIRINHLLGTTQMPADDGKQYEIHCFAAEVLSGIARAGDDAADLGWFTAEEINGLPLTPNLREDLHRFGVFP